MSRITITPDMQALLEDAIHTVDLVDEHGNLIGQFMPNLSPKEWDDLEPDISEEEIERRINEGGGRSLAEILADLEKRV